MAQGSEMEPGPSWKSSAWPPASPLFSVLRGPSLRTHAIFKRIGYIVFLWSFGRKVRGAWAGREQERRRMGERGCWHRCFWLGWKITSLIVLLLEMWVNTFKDRGREGGKSTGLMIHQVKLRVLKTAWIPCSKQNDLFSRSLSIPTASTVEGI